MRKQRAVGFESVLTKSGQLQKLAILLVVVTLAAVSSLREVSASQNLKPATLPLSIGVTWEINNRDGSPTFFRARHLFTEICDASGTTCYSDSFAQLDASGFTTMATNFWTGGPITVKLYAWAEINDNSGIWVWDEFADIVWQPVSPSFQPTNQSYYLIRFDSSKQFLPAFWIMDDFITGFLSIPSADRPGVRLEGRWHYNFDNLGPATHSFFCYDTPGFCQPSWIYIFQKDVRDSRTNRGKPDRVAIHEMGHAVQYYMYEQRMPAPSSDYWQFHYCDSWYHNLQIPGQPDCAFQEGWADFWRLYVLGSPTVTLIDGTVYDYERSVDIINDTEYSWHTGPEVPGRITASLWDIYDATGNFTEWWDTLVDGINGSNNNGIWNIITNDLYEPTTMVEFDSDWRTGSNPNDCAESITLKNNTVLATAQCTETCNDMSPNIAGTTGDDDIAGSTADDVVVGLGGDDYISGYYGNDELCGGNGVDTILGHDGNDYINGEGGADTLDGGPGSDGIYGDDGGDVLVGSAGIDTLRGDNGDDRLEGGTGNDTLIGSDHDDVVYGGDGNDAVRGNAGNDTLYGDAGNDTVYGFTGSDTLYGSTGDDDIRGGDDNDILNGDDGIDTLDGGNHITNPPGDECNDTSGAYVSNCESGSVRDFSCKDVKATVIGTPLDDTFIGTSGDDVMVGLGGDDELTGMNGNDLLCGGTGNDTLSGNYGADQLEGQEDNDIMYGGGNDDVLDGGDGDDSLDGGGHDVKDTCIGGLGADTFVNCEEFN